MQYFPQQQYGALPAQCQQCVLSPGYNNFAAGYSQPQQQQQYSPYGGVYPQQYYNNPYQQQQQQQQFYYPQQQQQFPYIPQAQAAFYPQQQQQQQQQYPFYPQQQWPNWPQGSLGQNASGYQQYWPQQHRVFEDPPTPVSSPRHGKEKSKKVYERYYQ